MPVKLVTEKQLYYNMVNIKNFKLWLDMFYNECPVDDYDKVKAAILGMFAIIELDAKADISNKELNVSKTKEHYRKYVDIAFKFENKERLEITIFIENMENILS